MHEVTDRGITLCEEDEGHLKKLGKDMRDAS